LRHVPDARATRLLPAWRQGAEPRATIDRLFRELGISAPVDISLPLSTTTLTPPQADKWRIEHPEVLDLPIEDMRRRLGYLGPLATPECD
jgi:hypothetical protein